MMGLRTRRRFAPTRSVWRQWMRIIPMWVWVKIKPAGDRLFSSWAPFTRVPCWVPMFDPQPCALGRNRRRCRWPVQFRHPPQFCRARKTACQRKLRVLEGGSSTRARFNRRAFVSQTVVLCNQLRTIGGFLGRVPVFWEGPRFL